MAKKRIKISEMTPATSLVGFVSLGYKFINGKKTSVQLDLSYVQTAYEKTVEATGNANTAAGKADKAAKDADGKMAQITEDANKKMTDLRQLEAEVSDDYVKWGDSYSQWQAAEQARQNAELKRQEEFAKSKTDAEAATGKANAAALNADLKAKAAEEQANFAKEQGEFAQQQIGKVSKYDSRITALEEGKVDGGYAEENMLYLTVDGVPVGDPIPVGSGTGGGGGSAGITCKVKSITDTLLSTVSGASVRIGYNFTSIYADDGSETGDGTATYTINSQKVATQAITQGDNYFDVGKWLVIGTNKVKVTVLDSTGQSRSLAYTVEVISLSLADSYDDTLVNTGEITYRYTPVGAIAKTVHFVLDGKEIATKETTDSNRQLSQVIPAQSHGAHRLVVYMTATVNGVEVRSNELAHDLICVTTGNNTVIVASSFNLVTAQQYDRLSIPFVVYNPAASTAAVTLSVDGVILSEQTVDRTLQTWTYRITKPGALVLKIASGSVSKTFNLDVTEAAVIVEPETADLELYLTSQNRSNSDNNKDEWKSGDISSTMSGFNWKTNGWVTDDAGSTCLRVNGGAQVVIPLMLFEKDFRATGKTVEVEFLVRDVYNYDTPVISCWSGERGILITSQTARIKSEQSDIETKFKDEERIRLAFVTEKRSDNRLLSIYVNGIKSQTFQYPETDNFMQAGPVGITIGGEDATVDIYAIRSYNNNLNRYQLLNNYIADIDDYDKKVEVFNKNDIYDAYGNVSFTKVNERIDCLVFEGDLPQYKGDKKTNKIYYYSSGNSVLNWWANVKNNVQGTSSQYYPRKNYKFEFIDGLTYIESGEQAEMFQVTDEVLPAKVFCIKTDFAESSGTHNTGVANYADWMLKEMGFLTEAQKEDPKTRTTVAGKPCVLFHKATPDSEPVFVGKVNLNTDKAAENTFGFKDGDESWEFLNNTSDLALFKSADFTKWQETIEARYPDGGADITEVKKIFDWVVSCKGDPAKFKAEYSLYFDKDMLVIYALLTLVFGMTDQRAKNMFLTRYRGKLWLFILYDNDTLLPINNEGLIALLYNVETHDTVNGANVWNGADSELWKLVEEAFADEIREMYYTMRQRNILSYDKLMDYLYTRQAGKWSEAIYNEDGYYKYEQPLIEGYLDYSQSHENPQTIKTGAYLYALQGSREMYGKWIWKNRFLYLDSKFLAGSILGDTAVFRTYTPAVWEGVEPCADLTLTAFNAMYFNVKWGSVTKSQRVGFNETKTMTAPENMQFNDTETIIYGASLIASLGDLSPLYPGTVDVSKMSRLKELIVGSGVEGYQNRNLRSLSIGTNRMLKKLDVRNCPEYSEPIELRNCTNIEEIYAQGTAITAVNLPEGGNLAKLYLPGTITNLTLKNQPKLLDAFFELAGVEKLSTIISESTPGVNIFPVVDRCLSMKNPALSRVRLIDLNATGANLDILYKLIKLGGVDEKGNNVATAVVTGKFHAVTAVEDKLAAIRAAFPELEVTYTNLKAPTVTTFTFSSSQSKTITNSTFECNFEAVKVSETTYKVTADDDSIIEFTFRCDNHEDYSDTYLVAGTRSQSYSITYIPLRKIRVKVYNQNLYIENARVIIGNDVYVTDADGYVTLKRGGEAVEGTVEAAGYAGNTFSFAAITNDTTHTVEVYAAVEVKFIVKDDLSNSVEGATVSCDGKEAITNLYGECILLLGKGTLSYTVTHPNCLDYIGEINIGTSAISVNVSLFLNPIVFKPKENGNIQMAYLGDRVADIYIISTTTDYIINWGDGSSDIAKGTSSSYEHTYTSKGIYQVEISNCENITKASGGRYSLYAYWSIGNSKINNISFDQCRETRYVGLVFENDINRQDFKSCFYYNQRLLFYAKGLLDKCVKAQNFSSFMGLCPYLQTVYIDTFDNCTEINNFSYSYKNCYELSKVVIPANVSDLGVETYYGCRSLKYIKAITITPPTIDTSTFYNTNNCPIYVPDESVDTYKTATNWSALAARIKPMSDFATDFPDEVLEEETA
ncbi:hypothetical protein DW083_06165 [Parabacteroides sp. AF48-14]|uniref:leucine-rich repeat protein n=1 Tax=Parabacteroides sp. AF48-14 TaxID=2292052 RepID=UPI000EFFE75C|nr:leucine-rich repeat protein [Parabacteroides sp. AF48-14]RHO73429.1 hypothetical protein DW083_06165 [Parabacteroides sp. AF48-14]